MAVYLTIPVAEGFSLANAIIHQGNTLTGLDVGVSYTCYRLIEAAKPFTYTGEPIDVVAPPDGNVTLGIAKDGQSYEMTVAEGIGTVVIKGKLYAFDTQDILGKAPVILGAPDPAAALPPALSDLDTVSYSAAPYLYDPSGGTPVSTLTTVRAGETLGQGSDYTVTDFDRIAGFTVQQAVTNSWGTRTTQKAVVEPLAYTPGTLKFGTTHALVKADGIQPDGADSVLVVVNMRPENRKGSLFRDAIGYKLRAYFTESDIGRIFASNTNNQRLLNYESWFDAETELVAGDRLCLMLHLRAATGLAQVMGYRNGAVVKSINKTTAAAGAKIDTTHPLTIGYTDFGSWHEPALRGGYQDFRIWCDLPENIDITLPSVAGWFISTDGSAKHPSIANSRLGPPRIWMPTDATQANALVNLGTAGDFTAKSGTFA